MTEERVKTINIDAELHRQMKVEAAKTNHSIRELVEAALRRYLKEGRR